MTSLAEPCRAWWPWTNFAELGGLIHARASDIGLVHTHAGDLGLVHTRAGDLGLVHTPAGDLSLVHTRAGDLGLVQARPDHPGGGLLGGALVGLLDHLPLWRSWSREQPGLVNLGLLWDREWDWKRGKSLEVAGG